VALSGSGGTVLVEKRAALGVCYGMHDVGEV
jgi:hypothetical protein